MKMSDLFSNVYNPDVLSCLANLSNDEVFTPPEVVNKMLDMLPQELFSNPDTTFLDPACKTGVFLREIAKRLIVGLEKQMPDLQERLDHIFHKQLFGIAITELTSLLSRRGLYCSKYPNGEFSVSKFDNAQGNIRFKRIEHTWKDGKCVFCGVNKKEKTYERDDMEVHAYEFIHTHRAEEILKMKFDVIIGNPPYQLNVGVEKENYAIPLYHEFIDRAKKMQPRFLSMIIPARWYAGGRGLDDFRQGMLSDRSIRVIHDFPDPSECFPGVQIKGGVCYFLWDRDHQGYAEINTHEKGKITSSTTRPLLEPGLDTFIRYNQSISILRKVQSFKEQSFSKLVSPQTPFGIISSFKNYTIEATNTNNIKFYTNKSQGYVNVSEISSHHEWIAENKIYISAAYGAGEGFPHQIINKPFVGEKNSCCSQTYLLIGPFDNENICKNVISYISTKFFRFLVMLKKNAQHAMRGVYELVPIQDFTKSWTDDELYKKYGISEEEIAFIDSMIRPMDLNGGEDDA